MLPLRALLTVAAKAHVFKASLRTALVVGLILNVINQWEAITGSADFSLPHLVMNFFVPFLVSSYSAARNEVSRSGNNPKE